ncbi:MAG: ribonuclease III [Lachnospiraceae bacterium]|nr:ribonuclease III [Lachnospiraceae bacterium]
MEESLSFLNAIRKEFACGSVDVKTYSPLTLAFVGDCVYDLIVRTLVVERANAAPNTLHKKKSQVVKAQSQAKQADALFEELTQQEQAVYKRGRNAHSHTSAKNASIADYRKATGLEALYGFLYLSDQTERLLYLVKRSFELTQTDL